MLGLVVRAGAEPPLVGRGRLRRLDRPEPVAAPSACRCRKVDQPRRRVDVVLLASARGASVGRYDEFLGLADDCWRTRAYGDFWSYMLVAEGAVDIAAEPELARLRHGRARCPSSPRPAAGSPRSTARDGPWGGNAARHQRPPARRGAGPDRHGRARLGPRGRLTPGPRGRFCAPHPMGHHGTVSAPAPARFQRTGAPSCPTPPCRSVESCAPRCPVRSRRSSPPAVGRGQHRRRLGPPRLRRARRRRRGRRRRRQLADRPRLRASR